MTEFYCGRKIQRRRPPRFDLVAGELCLDFVNTLDDRFTSEPKELLKTYVDLARFAEDTGILSASEVDRLFTRSQLSPDEAQSALAAAIELREAMYAVFWAIVNKKPAPRGELAKLNGFVQEAARRAQLVEAAGYFEWKFEDTLRFDAPLWPIARSAADLLASEQLELVRPCAAANCLWLFLDTSKNHRRRWCDMTKCGNRAKVQRFYKRKKKLAGGEGA
jgi:predicted RNA-binding Zn ribbon-like protein